jgi:cytoskeletal protein RodZ
VGESLRKERELRGVTLQEIADETKISVRNLQALESDEFDKLPGGIYTKNFIRAYCRHLGISEEQIVNDYLCQTRPRKERRHPRPVEREERQGTPPWILGALFLILVVAAVGAGYLVRWMRSPSPSTDSVEAPDERTAAARSASPAHSGPWPERIPLTFKARQDVWIELRVDGESVVDGVLEKGSETTVEMQDRALLSVSDAGALQWSIAGKPAKPLGNAGQLRQNIALDRSNLTALLETDDSSRSP